MSATTPAPDSPDAAEAAPLGAAHEPPVTAGALIKRAPLPAALGKYVLSDDEIRRSWRVSSALAASGMFKDAKQAEVAFAKVLLGRDLGISPTQALMSLDIVKGNVQMRGVLLASFVRRSATYDYRVIELDGEDPDEAKQRATVRFFAILPNGEREALVPDITYTTAMARKTGNVKADSAWMTARRNMLFWRAMSDGVKFHCPDLLGGVAIYTEADTFPPDTAALGEGTGDGQALGIDLGPDVEAVLARAADLGHAALADRATVEMLLGDQPPAKVVEWVRAANRELDAIPRDAEVVEAQERPVSAAATQTVNPPREAENGREAPAQPPDAAQSAEAVEGEAVVEDIEVTRRRAMQMLDAADVADAAGNVTEGDALRDEAADLMEIVERADAGQIGMPL